MSWALEAIEREAMARARREMPNDVTLVMGLRVDQITALKVLFQKRTGQKPALLTSTEIMSCE